MSELMKPRYEVIADYPKSVNTVGAILTIQSFDKTHPLYGNLDKYPHLFRKLSWWEKRKPEEMPEYVRTPDKKVFKVHHWSDPPSLAWIEEECFDIYCDRCEPATLEDFTTYNNK